MIMSIEEQLGEKADVRVIESKEERHPFHVGAPRKSLEML